MKAAQRGGVGSPLWMAPELFTFSADGQLHTVSPMASSETDVYSLGITMWEMIVAEVGEAVGIQADLRSNMLGTWSFCSS